MADVSTLQFLVQGGFAALFVWLLIDTRKEAAKREEQLNARLTLFDTERAQTINSLARISSALERIETRLDGRD